MQFTDSQNVSLEMRISTDVYLGVLGKCERVHEQQEKVPGSGVPQDAVL